eukprot:2263268-Amphidinium_carterae.1
MPLPWCSGRSARNRAPIPDVAHRAITIKQLKDLRTFLRRLTASNLLKHTTKFSESCGTKGESLQWTDLNLYHITDEVIKKVIPYVDPDGEKDPAGSRRRWYSWVEFVAEKKQPAKIML